jgi:hypothetical protein
MDAAEQGLCSAYYGASPTRLLRRLAFWKTPVARCGYRGRTDCVSYDAWRRAWVKIRA